jgi:TRAP-type C4-dicarboxylate transport system permease large subunit
VFAVNGVVKDVPLMEIFKGATPFFFVMAVCLAILVAFPVISLLLPGLMMAVK